MKKVAFFTAVRFDSQPRSCSQALLEAVDGYFYLGGKKAHVILGRTQQSMEGVTLTDDTAPLLISSLKVVSYFTVVLPALFLTTKAVLRSTHTFYILSPEENKKIEDPALQAFVRTRVAQKNLREAEQREAAQVLQAFIKTFLVQKELEPRLAIERDRKSLEDGKEVREGWGEFIVSRFEEGHFSPVDLETYKKTFMLFLKYDLVLWATTGDLSLLPRRVELLTQEVETIDPRLRVTFIPKVLYELTFFIQSIRWALDQEAAFTYKDPMHPTPTELAALQEACSKHRDPWLQGFEELKNLKNPLESDLFLNRVYELNRVLCELLGKESSPHFTFPQLQAVLESYLQFLQEIHEDSESALSQRAQKFLCPNPSQDAPFIAHFVAKYPKLHLDLLGLKNEDLADLVRQSLEVECLAGRVLLYRGATPGRNDLYDNRHYRSISYGTSLYAGCIHDIGASAFDYMSQEQNAATILALPAAELRKGVFYIPVEHTLLQIFGWGEEFHSRSKVWEMQNPETLITGILPTKTAAGNQLKQVRYWRALPDFLKSKLSKQAFFEEFYKAQQFLLTLKEAR